MIITPSMVFYLLSREFDVKVVRESETGAVISVPMLYSEAPIMIDALYICESVDQISRQSSFRCSYIAVDNIGESFECDCPCAIIKTDLAPQLLLYKVFVLIQNLQIWDCQMKDLCRRDATLPEVFAQGEKLFKRPFGLIDAQYIYIAYTDGYIEHNGNKGTVAGQTSIPTSVLNELLFDDEFVAADRIRGPALYPSYTCDDRLVFINFYKENEYIARLLAHIDPTGISAGEQEIFVCMAGYVQEVYFMQSENKFHRQQKDRFHTMLKQLLSESGDAGHQSMAADMCANGWLDNHDYQVVVIRTFDAKEFRLVAPYLCNQLENAISPSCSIAYENEIIWIINMSLSKERRESEFMDTVKLIVKDLVCKAGISMVYKGIYNIALLRVQAAAALRLGQTKKPHIWYYKFGDYAFDYMLSQLKRELPKEFTCHPGLKKLIELDSVENTGYVNNLVSFIKCGFNVSSAAEDSFVARSTFIRQLERIKKTSCVKFEDEIDLRDFSFFLISLMLFSDAE